MEVTGLARNLMKGKNWSLRSYARVPSISGTGRTLTVSTSPILIFQYDMKTEYGVPRPTDTAFKINQRNIAKVIDFFQEALAWLASPTYKNLFIQDDHEGRILVNMDYQGLQKMVHGSKYDAQVMLGFPIVYVEDGKEEPGLGISVNRKEYTFAMKEDDLRAIHHALTHFSFQAEALLLVQLAANPQLWEPETGMSDPRITPSSSPRPNDSWDGSSKLTW